MATEANSLIPATDLRTSSGKYLGVNIALSGVQGVVRYNDDQRFDV